MATLRDQVWSRLGGPCGIEGLAPGGGEAVLAGVAFDEAAEIGGGDFGLGLAAGADDEEALGPGLGLS